MSNLPCLKNFSADEITKWFNCDKSDTDYEKLTHDKIILKVLILEIPESG